MEWEENPDMIKKERGINYTWREGGGWVLQLSLALKGF